MDLKIFSGQANEPLAQAIARSIERDVGEISFGRHPDGEQWLQYEESIRGNDVFLIQPTSYPVEFHLVQLLLMIDAAKRASAGRITFVIPYFGYQRQDRKDRPRVPISSGVAVRAIEETAEGGGMQYRALLMDLHVAQLEQVFRCPVDHLTARPVFAEYYRDVLQLDPDELVVVSPDIGGGKLAASYANRLSSNSIAFVYKLRKPPRVDAETAIESSTLVGDVRGKNVLLVDDIVDTAGTLVNAAGLLADHGARDIYACCTHATLSKNAPENIRNSAIRELCISDTLKPCEETLERAGGKIIVRSVAQLIGKAIWRIHNNESVTSLFQ